MADAKKPKSPIVLVKEFFGLSAQEAMAESKKLTDEDKQQLATGITSGSLTY